MKTSLVNLSRRLLKNARSQSFKLIYPRWPALHNAIFFELRRQLIRFVGLVSRRSWVWMPEIFAAGELTDQCYTPLVSIVVPSFNHASFLRQRLESIASQTYRNTEIILLDDCSSDGSQDILNEFFRQHRSKTRLILNDTNSGKPFLQWQRGISLARGDLIWIAESDDFCEPDFLERLIPCFLNRGVMIAMGRSRFVSQDGTEDVWSMEHYLPNLGTSFWKKPFTETTHRLVQKQWATRNIIPNASGCLFRKPTNTGIHTREWWQSLRVCGDWLFYLDLARGGLVAYSPEAVNCYRQHASNSSVGQHKQRLYFEEHLCVAEWLGSHFTLSDKVINSIEKELKKRWSSCIDSELEESVKTRIRNLAVQSKKPNLLIVTYALVGGGGEIFPVRLANGLRDQGYTVTLLNCNQRATQAEVLGMIQSSVPTITLERLQDVGQIINHFSIDVVHTHHAWVDTTVAELIGDFPKVKQVITSHGMYDYMDDAELRRIGRLLRHSVKVATYVSATNRKPLEKLGFEPSQMVHISNATKSDQISPFDRQTLGISKSSLVICLVSRAIKEKGWQEAIKAVCLLRQQSSREIDLLLVGDGAIKDDLVHQYGSLPFIHFLGFRSDTCNLFAGSDLGLLPSFFMGESQPLTLIESLLAGTPYIASDLGDISKMLGSEEGIAGQLIPIRNAYCHPEDIAAAIDAVLRRPNGLEQLRHRARHAAKKFSWDSLLSNYEQVYNSVISD